MTPGRDGSIRRSVVRVLALLVVAAVGGAALAAVKGRGYDLAHILGNAAAPYPVIAFFVGRACRSRGAAAAMGVLTTLAIPVLVGVKTRRERFAGATNTKTCEAMMEDGKALQMATSHELGQNFARAFDIGYTDSSGQQQTCWTTSWGASTRMVGGLIMAHGDDDGLRLPPRVAPVQAVVIAAKDDERTIAAATALVEDLLTAGVRARLDARTTQGFGRRATEWELKGVPLRIEVGPRDLDSGQVTLVRRDRSGKTAVALTSIVSSVPSLLKDMHADLFENARKRLEERTVDAASLDEALAAAKTGFARIPWRVLGEEGEALLNKQAVTVRCLQTSEGTFPEDSTNDEDLFAIVGRSY